MNYVVRGGAHQGCISKRRVFSSSAEVLLPLFVLEYQVQPLPLDVPALSHPISKHLAQRMIGEMHSRRKLKRRLHATPPMLSSLFDLAPRDTRWDDEIGCCDADSSCPKGLFHDPPSLRLAQRIAAPKEDCDAIRMEEVFLERSVIVQSQSVAPTWDQRRSSKFRRSAGIIM